MQKANPNPKAANRSAENHVDLPRNTISKNAKTIPPVRVISVKSMLLAYKLMILYKKDSIVKTTLICKKYEFIICEFVWGNPWCYIGL